MFSVSTFNVLAKAYAREASFPYAAAVLPWSDRFPRLAAAIKELDADLVMLQEVDEPQDW